jgi:hypothetical protein|tara:strand:- start:6 stop:443 length:438 start_codon:yes stop_codon:yes gene_type:complete
MLINKKQEDKIIMWNELKEWEERHNALVYGVLTTEDVRETLSYYQGFDVSEPEELLVDIHDVSESLIRESMHYAYDSLEDPTYTDMLDCIHERLIDVLKERINDAVQKQNNKWENANLYVGKNDVFQKYGDFKQQQAELNLKGGA